MVRYDASAVAKAMADESHHSPRTVLLFLDAPKLAAGEVYFPT